MNTTDYMTWLATLAADALADELLHKARVYFYTKRHTDRFATNAAYEKLLAAGAECRKRGIDTATIIEHGQKTHIAGAGG